MKKLFSLLLALVASITLFAQEEPSGYDDSFLEKQEERWIQYYCYDATMTAIFSIGSSVSGKDYHIVIPNTITSPNTGKEYKVTDVLSVEGGNVVSIVFSENLKKIRASLLYKQPITSVEIPASVDSIDNAAFSQCKQLTSVTFHEGLRYIGPWAFSDCEKLTSVVLPYSLEEIGQAGFAGSGLTSIEIPNNMRSLGPSAFYICADLVSASIQGSVKEVGDYAFMNCSKLESLTLYEGVTTIGKSAFSSTVIVGLTLPESLTTIKEGAFAGTQMSSIVIPDNVTTLENMAFRSCDKLESITIGKGVKRLEGNVFTNSTGKLSTLILSEGLEVIGDEAFKDASSLSDVTWPQSLQSIGKAAFSGTALSLVSTKAEIGNMAFMNCMKLTSVALAEGCSTIGDEAFKNASFLADVSLPKSLVSIGNEAFSGTAIPSISTQAEIGDLAFINCNYLTSVSLLEGCKSVGKKAFMNDRSIETVIFPSTLESIGEEAFSQNVLLKEAILPAGLTALGKNAFYRCEKLTALSLGKSLTSIPEACFAYCLSLNSPLVIPSSVESVGKEAFYGDSKLLNLTIGPNVKSIDERAFGNCSKIGTITALPIKAPTTDATSFSAVPTTAAVSVPCSGIDSYTSAWSNFTNITGIIPIYAESEDDVKGSVKVTYAGDCTNPLTVMMATPNEGYKFTMWSDGNTDNPRTITTAEPMNLIALFEIPTAIREVREQSSSSYKVLRDGQLFILRSDKVYTVTGQEVK